jgi:hypothetical protein
MATLPLTHDVAHSVWRAPSQDGHLAPFLTAMALPLAAGVLAVWLSGPMG